MQVALGRIQEQRSQQISLRREVRRERTGHRVRCEAVKTASGHEGRYRKLFDEAEDTVVDVLGLRVNRAVVTRELVEVRGGGGVHAERPSQRIEDLR